MEISESIELNANGKRSLALRHPWIYQRSCAHRPEIETGSLVRVTADNATHAIGFFDAGSLYAVKVLDFSDGSTPLDTLITDKLRKAYAYRISLGIADASRLFHAEADGIPGLFIDRYGAACVVKYEHRGAWGIREFVSSGLRSILSDIPIFEIDPEHNRRWLDTPPAEPLSVTIDGIRFQIDPFGQKTGFYLDQTDNRRALARLLKPESRVLDAFAYTGGFSLYALKAGAIVTAVECVARHASTIETNCRLNGFSPCTIVCGRVEEYLASTSERFDAIFLDPPSLIERRSQKKKALQYVAKLVRGSLKVLAPGGLFAVSVCSQALTDEELPRAILSAVAGSGRTFRLVHEGRASADHPVLLSFPEGDYLRCMAFQQA